MAEDWDLYAVVRSCTNSAAASTTSSTMNTTNPIITPAVQNTNQELGESFVTDPFRNDDIPSDFPGFVRRRQDSFQGLEEIYKEQRENTQPYAINSTSSLAHQHNHSDSILQEFQNQQQYTQHAEQLLLYPQDMTQPHHQQQHLHMIRHHGIIGSSALTFPSTTSSQPIRPRRRKNQQAKMIHRMTQDELSGDSWAWRKYGQKPIKGSPYPRNYYRCSTSKGCTARRQVERCPTDPNMYVVSYSGEHSHPRPTHRSSLAGSTRNKVIPAATKTSSSSEPKINTALTTNSMASSSSPVSASSFSPRHQDAAEENVEEGADAENHNVEILFGEEEEEGEGWDDDDDDDNGDGDILVPNTFIDHY